MICAKHDPEIIFPTIAVVKRRRSHVSRPLRERVIGRDPKSKTTRDTRAVINISDGSAAAPTGAHMLSGDLYCWSQTLRGETRCLLDIKYCDL